MPTPRSPSFFKSLAYVAIPTALLIVATLLFDLASASVYVYPELDFGQSGPALILLGATWIATAIFLIVCLGRQKIIIGLFLLGALAVPILLGNLIDRAYWRFSNMRDEYLTQIRQDTSASPKYKVFDWGNRNISLGGGVEFEAIIFDESDDLLRPSTSRSPDWRGNPGLSLPGERWITADPPDCKRRIKSFGDHFYYVTQSC